LLNCKYLPGAGHSFIQGLIKTVLMKATVLVEMSYKVISNDVI